MGLPLLRWRNYSVTTGTANTARSLRRAAALPTVIVTTGLTATSATRAGNLVTVTKAGHGFPDGAVIKISGADQAAYNGSYQILVTSSSVFKYEIPYSLATGATTATGTVNLKQVDYPVVTITGHRLLAGDYLIISASEKVVFNGPFRVVTVIDADNFTIYVPGSTAAGDPVSATANFVCHAQRAIVVADASNAAAVSIGADSNADHYPIAAGLDYLFEGPHGAKFDLADLYIKSTSATQTVNVLYI